MSRGTKTEGRRSLSNAEIADRLSSLAQLLGVQKENFYKVKAYHRAAARIRTLAESLDEMVRDDSDLTQFPGIGEAIAAAIREIVLTGSLSRLEKLRSEVTPHLASISQYPRLDPKRVARIYKKLDISTTEELRERLENGEIAKVFGQRMAAHVRQGIDEAQAMLLYQADSLRDAVEEFLAGPCAVDRADVAGDVRRRAEVIDELAFVVATKDFPRLVERVQRYGGRTPLIESGEDFAVFALAAGIRLRLQLANADDWGFRLLTATGSEAHLKELAQAGLLEDAPSEQALYAKLGLAYIEPELREGRGEVELAAHDHLPQLVAARDLRGELHAHSTSSDGVHSIEQMTAAAREHGYEYIGITDHSQSLKIARGLSVQDLWAQIRYIDGLNAKLPGIRILKSSEVDILADGSLDYPDELLRELDYTVCSIHSRFALNRQQQTERALRAMDNRYFNIMGHPTGRLLLKRSGYEIDIERVIEHARENGCFFEINSSPDRLDLAAANARIAAASGVMIAVSTDAHSTRDFRLTRWGVDQARRAGLTSAQILNCQPWSALERLFRR